MLTTTRTQTLLSAIAAATLLAACGQSGNDSNSNSNQNTSTDQSSSSEQYSREQVRVVGSSTVYPFSSYVAEELGATTDYTTPVVEATGSGGGMKVFCSGVGENTPDVTNASRQMKPSEFEMCRNNGVEDITEVMFGYDGIVVGFKSGAPALDLSREQLTLAVASEVPQDGELVDNPYTNWSQIDSSLPDQEILIYGPPSSSGTRDAFEELVIEHAAENIDGYGGDAPTVRQDGAFVPSGENDNLIVQRLAQNPTAIGIFGYSFLEENRDKIQAANIDGVAPERALISSGEYPISRSLYFYTKNAHIDKVAAMPAYVDLFLSDQMISERGALKSLGLISLPEDQLQAIRQAWENRKTVTADMLKDG